MSGLDTTRPTPVKPQAFFLKTTHHQGANLFALHYRASSTTRHAVILVPPFAEEMNKSRRMFTLLAQALSLREIDSFLLDLYGTGDSEGEFGAATVEDWLLDLDAAYDYLRNTGTQQISVVALRFGALLAEQWLCTRQHTAHQIVYWQPMTSGKTMLTQFFRLRLAASMKEKKETVASLQTQMRAEGVIEIAGYEIAQVMHDQIDSMILGKISATQCTTCHWMELVSEEGRELLPASRKVIDSIIGQGVVLQTHSVVGPNFWSSVEIMDAPRLIEQTENLF